MGVFTSNKNLLMLQRVIMTLIGTLIVSISINGLYIPHNIMSGGVSGLAIWSNLTMGWNISLVIVLVNIPIFIIGYKFINREFIVYSAIGMSSLVVFLQLTNGLVFEANEILTTVLLGGFINGVGFGLILRVNSSTGGNDILSKILNKYFSYSISTLNFMFNSIIIAISIGFFGLDIAVQTLAAMFVSSQTIQFIVEGVNYKRTLLIITKEEAAVAKAINESLGRGCTILSGKGSYTGKDKSVLYAVISINQVAKLKMLIRQVDEEAFINVIETRVVFGNGKGFFRMKEE